MVLRYSCGRWGVQTVAVCNSITWTQGVAHTGALAPALSFLQTERVPNALNSEALGNPPPPATFLEGQIPLAELTLEMFSVRASLFRAERAIGSVCIGPLWKVREILLQQGCAMPLWICVMEASLQLRERVMLLNCLKMWDVFDLGLSFEFFCQFVNFAALLNMYQAHLHRNLRTKTASPHRIFRHQFTTFLEMQIWTIALAQACSLHIDL